MDVNGIPWLSLTAAAGGWTLFGATLLTVMRAVTRGDWTPRPVVEAMQKRIDAQDAELKEERNQKAALMEGVKLSNEAMAALRMLAESQGGR